MRFKLPYANFLIIAYNVLSVNVTALSLYNENQLKSVTFDLQWNDQPSPGFNTQCLTPESIVSNVHGQVPSPLSFAENARLCPDLVSIMTVP